jgi:hypothetical protein
MFSLRETLANRQANRQLPPRYAVSMGIVVLCGRRPVSITHLRNSPCPQSVVVHFKSLLPVNDAINLFIANQLTAMQRLFAEGDIAVLPGSATEDLSGNATLVALQPIDVGTCPIGATGTTTADQNTVFANRNNAGADDVVIYLVNGLTSPMGNTVGCSQHPAGQPGCVITQINADWLTAHEVAHILGVRHVCEMPPTTATACVAGSGQSDSLMFPNVGWTNVPPDLSATEFSTMVNSSLTVPCQD